jgi:hypothetical protein
MPGCWALAEDFRACRGVDLPSWPDWCYLPMAGWMAIASSGGGTVDLQHAKLTSRLAAIGAWRMTLGIYRFDPALAGALVDTELSGEIPCDVLLRMPEWSLYLETPMVELGDERVHGAWCHLESDANTGGTELRLLLDLDRVLVPIPVHLGSWPLAEGLAKAAEMAHRNAIAHGIQLSASNALAASIPAVRQIVNLLLYVCALGADMTQRGQTAVPANPEPVSTRRHGTKTFAANKETVWDVGVRIGAALRAAYQREETGGDAAPTGRGVRPHVRRAHWHVFVSGPRLRDDGSAIAAGERIRELRWLPPIPVNVDDYAALPAVVHPVGPR